MIYGGPELARNAANHTALSALSEETGWSRAGRGFSVLP